MTITKNAFFAAETGAAILWNAIIRHIFGGANRKLSEKYGLVVYLCGNRCHRNGPYAVHRNAGTAEMIHRYGQEKCMSENGLSIEEFRKIFGRSYI